MSRYDLVSKAEGQTVAAGWDGPLDTFFYQVFRLDLDGDEPEEPIDALGQTPGECRSVDHFLTMLARHAALPDAFRHRLLADQEAEPHDPNTAGAQFLRLLEEAESQQRR